MGKIFISHSSANNAEALAIRAWLEEKGWDDVFLDLDPRRGLVAGDRWQAALKAAADQCELILTLISPHWASSKWCLTEFMLAKQMNKQILAVIVEPTPLSDLPVELTAEWQLVDLSAADPGWSITLSPPVFTPETVIHYSGAGLARLEAGLEKAGLDPTKFLWPPAGDPNRAPYRGLLPLDGDDAGIFFGRDGAIVLTLDALRGLREGAAPRFATILGASGAGKSSFLRAGILPRLARDSRNFQVLPVIRPERAALTGEHGFAAMLESALRARNILRNRGDLRAAVLAGASAVRPLLKLLVAPIDAGNGPVAEVPPALVIAVDQAEELLASDNAEAGPFLTLLAELGKDDDPAVMVLFTVRSDSFDLLQARPELAPTQPHHLVDLPPVPFGAYSEIIRGPARRVSAAGRKLSVEEPLVDALLADIEKGGAKDALPLLAFTLERLYSDYGADGDLQLAEYEQLGRIGGAIEAAVEQALALADANPAIPHDRAARLALLRRGLIPWLAGIDPATGSPRRRVARLSEVPEEARPLMDLMVGQRLLSTDLDKATNERTIEPAHEALLRQWGALDGWLVEDSADLSALEALRRAATDWAANGRVPEFVVHKGARLAAATQIASGPKFSGFLSSVDRDYLTAADGAEETAKARARRLRVGLSIAAAIVGVILVAGLTAGWFIWQAGEAAKSQATAYFQSARSEAALRLGQAEAAAQYAFGAQQTLPDPRLRTAAINAGVAISPYLVAVQPVGQRTKVQWIDDNKLALIEPNGQARAADMSARSIAQMPDVPAKSAGAAFDDSGSGRLFFSDGHIADFQGNLIAAAPGDDFASEDDPPTSTDGKVVLFVGLIGNALLRDCRSLPCSDSFLAPPGGKSTAQDGAVSPEGDRVYVVWDGDTIVEYGGAAEPKIVPVPAEVTERPVWIEASSGGRLAVLAGGAVAISDTASGTYRLVASSGVTNMAFSPGGDSLAMVCKDSVVCIYTSDGRFVSRLTGNISSHLDLKWSRKGTYLATLGQNDPLRVWSPRKQNDGLLTILGPGRGPDLQSLAIDRKRGLIAAGDEAGYVWLWSGDGSSIHYDRPEGIGGPVPVSSLAFLEDGSLAAVYQNSGVGIIAPGDKKVATYFPLENASFSRVAALDGDVRAAVPLTDKRVMVLSGNPLHPAMLEPDTDGLTPWGLISAGETNSAFLSYSDGSIRRRDFATPAPGTTTFDASTPVCGLATTGDNNGARSLAVSPDGKWLAATRTDSSVVLHNLVDTSKPICLTLLSPDSRVVAFSPDSRKIAILGATDRLYVFDLAHPDAADILGAQLIADLPSGLVDPLGRDLRQMSWLDWIDNQSLAIAAINGQVLRLNLDPAAWRARIDSLFFAQ